MKTMNLYLYFEKWEVVCGQQVVPGMLGLKIRLIRAKTAVWYSTFMQWLSGTAYYLGHYLMVRTKSVDIWTSYNPISVDSQLLEVWKFSQGL